MLNYSLLFSASEVFVLSQILDSRFKLRHRKCLFPGGRKKNVDIAHLVRHYRGREDWWIWRDFKVDLQRTDEGMVDEVVEFVDPQFAWLTSSLHSSEFVSALHDTSAFHSQPEVS